MQAIKQRVKEIKAVHTERTHRMDADISKVEQRMAKLYRSDYSGTECWHLMTKGRYAEHLWFERMDLKVTH